MNQHFAVNIGRSVDICRSLHVLRRVGWLVVLLITLLAACSPAEKTTTKEKPAELVSVGDSDLKQIKLTEKAAERIGVQTVVYEEYLTANQIPVEKKSIPNTGVKAVSAIPYSAILYDVNGDTWVYVNTEPLTFLRQQVKVVRIEGDQVILAEGLRVGTKVVTTGTIELYGAETGVGK